MSCCPHGSWGTPLKIDTAKSASNKLITIGDAADPLELYVSGSDSMNKKALLVFTDVYGFQNRLFAICDHLSAKLNCYVVAIDNFRGETMDDHPDDFWEWTSCYPYNAQEKGSDAYMEHEELHPIKKDIEITMHHLKTEHGIDQSKISAVGFCWGVWPVTKACSLGLFKCGVGFHPSLQFEDKFGGDMLEMVKSATDQVPLLYCVSGNDPDYLKKGGSVAVLLEESKHTLNDESTRPRCVDFPEMKHGWVSRGDTTVQKVRDDAEEALTLATDFLRHWM